MVVAGENRLVIPVRGINSCILERNVTVRGVKTNSWLLDTLLKYLNRNYTPSQALSAMEYELGIKFRRETFVEAVKESSKTGVFVDHVYAKLLRADQNRAEAEALHNRRLRPRVEALPSGRGPRKKRIKIGDRRVPSDAEFYEWLRHLSPKFSTSIKPRPRETYS